MKYQATVTAPHPDHGMRAATRRNIGAPMATREEARAEALRVAYETFPHIAARRAAFMLRVEIRELRD